MDAGSVADAPVQQAEAPPPASAGAVDSPSGVAETAPASGQVGAQDNPIKSIPDHGDTDTWIQWLKDNGFFTDAQVKKDFEQLASNLAKYYNPNATKSDTRVENKIDKNIRQLEKAGIYIDRDALILSYKDTSGGTGDGGTGGGGGDGSGGTGGTGNGGGGDGSPPPPPDSGYDIYDIGNPADWENLDIYKRLAGGDPDAVKAWEATFEYLKWLESNTNQQLAVDTYAQYADFLKNNPSFQGIDEWIANGPNMTLTPEDIERMKTSGREMYGQGLTSLDQQIRQQAAASGVPTSDLGGIQARARAGLLSGLMGNERSIDLRAAEMDAADEALYYQQMLAGAQTTAAPWAQYYGGLSGLISGTPGLAGTGNPFAGLSDYNLMRQEQQEGLSGYDRSALLGSQAGIGLNLFGQGAGIASGLGA